MAMSEKIHVRMYNVGFGDCFLLTLPGKHTILVDAGFHSQGKGSFSGNELAAQIIADVEAISGRPRIDVVVATHRHQDHIFAFNSDAWAGVEVGEVWMPWVEDRANPEAMGLWKKQLRFAMQLAEALPTFSLSAADAADVQFMLWNAGAEIAGVAEFAASGGWSNKGALDCLHEGFARRDRTRPRFLPEGMTSPETFETPVLPGVKVHVLGPPRDPELIEELDPESDGETYRALALRAAAHAASSGGDPVAPPFSDTWQVPDLEAGFALEPTDIERMNDLAQGADPIFAAEKLDGMINSTSLVIVLQIGSARLLLPGDAEWGPWKRILANEDARTLVRSSTFFKVGHHGSHNATSKTLVEKVLPAKIPAMVSTQQGAGNYRNRIPLSDLMTAFDTHKIHYVRSDRVANALPKGFKTGPDSKWVDLQLPC
jgi:beta-lactamase superfamily II metal-dependent hydrolase